MRLLARKKRFVLILALVIISLFFFARKGIYKDSGATPFISTIAYFEDSASEFTESDIVSRNFLFNSASGNTLNFGLSPSTWWIWVKLKRTDLSNDTLLLELGYPHLDTLDVFSLEEGAPVIQHRIGDMVPFTDRPVKDRTFVLPVSFRVDQRSTELLLKVRSGGSIQLPMNVRTELQYQLQDRDEQLLLGFYYGILLGVFAYNFLLAFGTREAVYGYYCAYAVSLILFQFSQNGLGFEYLWPHSMNWQQLSVPIFASLALFFCTRFTRLFLNISSDKYPRLDFSFKSVELVFLLLAIASVLADRLLVIALISVAVSVAGIFMLGAAVYIYLKGDQNAHYYLLAWSILLFGIVIYATKTLGIIPDVFITEYSVQIGSAFEMILLSYALADRFNRLREENIRIHTEAQATLESRVEQRTQELRNTMQQLEAANSQLESINQRDSLTNVYNRRYFNEVLEPLKTSAVEEARPVSLLMIDIDHFKSINDTRGHLVGDEVIRGVARIVNQITSSADGVAARFGGEEFVALIPDHDQSSAIAVAEQLRLAVEDLVFNSENGLSVLEDSVDAFNPAEVFSVSISVGIATEFPGADVVLTGLELVDQADQALYTAKQSGRNRWHCFEAPVTDAPDSFAA